MLTVSILLNSVEKVQRFVSKISRYSCSFDVESGNSYVDGKFNQIFLNINSVSGLLTC